MPAEHIPIRRVVLASGSPRRRELISWLGLPFVVRAASVDENPLDGETPYDLVRRVSQAKARAVGPHRPDELVVAADTIVVLDGVVLGKPADHRDAERMLRALRGREHTVLSGVAVWHEASRQMVYELGESRVWMRHYADEEIARYVASGDPLDKAGAYAIQHAEFDPVSRVEGCSLGVVGLPLCHLARALLRFGLDVGAGVPARCRAFSQQECSLASTILAAVGTGDRS